MSPEIRKASERSAELMQPPWAERNRKGELLDIYGVENVFEGSPIEPRWWQGRSEPFTPASNRGYGRYLLWSGYHQGSGQGRGTFSSLKAAKRRARQWQLHGHYVRISDRLIAEGE